jgi:hypothetical protein
MRTSIMVEPAGRHPCCLRCPPVAGRRPLSVSLDTNQCFSAQRDSQRPPRRRSLFPSGRRRSRIPSLTGSAPRSLAGPVSGPEDRPRSDRPAIRRTMPEGLTGPPKEDAPIVVQRGSGDITEQFRYQRMSADMVNTRAAKFAGEANDSLTGLVGAERSGDQSRKQSQSHHSFDRSGRSRNPTRGSVGLTRGLLASRDRSTSEFVSRPPNSLARPSCVFLLLSTRRRRSTRRMTAMRDVPLSLRKLVEALAPRTVHPSRGAESPREGRWGSPRLPLRETNSSGRKGFNSDEGRAFLTVFTVPQGRADDAWERQTSVYFRRDG